DRSTASRLGISAAMIDNTLYDAYGQRQVSTMFTQLNQYHVVLEVQPGFQKNPSGLNDLYIRTGSAPGVGVTAGGSTNAGLSAALSAGATSAAAAGSTVAAPAAPAAASSAAFPGTGQTPLSTFSHVEFTSTPVTINHQGQFPVVTISFNLAPNASL